MSIMIPKSISYYAGEDIAYPSRPTRPPRPTPDSPASEYRAYASKLEEHETAYAEWREKSDAYRVALNAREKELRVDLAAVYGLTPGQVDVLYNAAYESGHSSGLSEVINKLDDLMDLVLAFNNAK